MKGTGFYSSRGIVSQVINEDEDRRLVFKQERLCGKRPESFKMKMMTSIHSGRNVAKVIRTEKDRRFMSISPGLAIETPSKFSTRLFSFFAR